MAATLVKFKAYARLLPDDTDPSAELCYNAALDHAASCGINCAILTDNSKFELYIYALALHYYDNRGFIPSSQAYAVDEYTRRLMAKFKNELRFAGIITPETEETDGV